MKIRVHHILNDTVAEGPGRRFCIWVQGCCHRCPGCFAEDTWDPDGGHCTDTADIIVQIGTQLGNIEGITFLGGEPFMQAEALAEIAAYAKERGLSVFCFTGYTIEELPALGDAAERLLSYTDVLADGRYVREKRDFSRPWVGSSNQRFHFLTDRYKEQEILGTHNKIELRLKKDGSIMINGMGDYTYHAAGSSGREQ